MFSPVVRFGLVTLMLALGAYRVIDGDMLGWIYILAASWLTFGYFRYGAVWAAWRALKKHDYKRAKTLISTVHNPRNLSAQQLAYYHFIHGILQMHESEYDAAAGHLVTAAEGKLRTSNDRSVVFLTLAEIKAKEGKIDFARNYLERARETPHKGALDDVISQVESLVDEASEKLTK